MQRGTSNWYKDLVILRRLWRLYAAEHFGQHKLTLIYQMGKVGSTSIQCSLQQQGIGPVYRLHVLAPENFYLLYPRKFGPSHPAVRADKRRYARLGAEIYRYICVKRKPVKIITPVRDPIARNVSLFFENLLEYHLPPGATLADVTMDGLKTIFLKQVRHAVALNWFDVEMRRNLGIDVYAHSFPKETGYTTVCKGNIDLLLLKAEIDDRLKEKVIADFIGLENFALENSNTAGQKPYGSLYREFVEDVKLPTNYVEAMTGSKYTRHFYSAHQIKIIRDRWQGVQD